MIQYPSSNPAYAGFQQPGSGLNNVSEYIASGMPFVTSSVYSTTVVRIDFPFVTSELYFRSGGGSLRFGFTQNGVNGSNYWIVGSGEHESFRIRCKKPCKTLGFSRSYHDSFFPDCHHCQPSHR